MAAKRLQNIKQGDPALRVFERKPGWRFTARLSTHAEHSPCVAQICATFFGKSILSDIYLHYEFEKCIRQTLLYTMKFDMEKILE